VTRVVFTLAFAAGPLMGLWGRSDYEADLAGFVDGVVDQDDDAADAVQDGRGN
jgi:hypothetical protein